MLIHYLQHTHFAILNYQQNHRLWRKTVKSWSFSIYKIPNYLQNHRLWRKNSQNWYYIIQKIIKRSILASHVQCLLQKRTSHQVTGAFNTIQHMGDILPKRASGDFYVSFAYRHCHEQSTCCIVP